MTCVALWPLHLTVSLGTFRTTSLSFDGLVWTLFAQARLLAALTVLRGAYAPEFAFLCLGEARLGHLIGGSALGDILSDLSGGLGHFAGLGATTAGVGRLGKDEGEIESTTYYLCVRGTPLCLS